VLGVVAPLTVPVDDGYREDPGIDARDESLEDGPVPEASADDVAQEVAGVVARLTVRVTLDVTVV
jgi:hypothetical protein